MEAVTARRPLLADLARRRMESRGAQPSRLPIVRFVASDGDGGPGPVVSELWPVVGADGQPAWEEHEIAADTEPS